MAIALSTGCLHRWDVEDILDAAVSAGYANIELLWSRENRNLTLAEVRSWLEARGLRCAAVHAPFIWLPGWGTATQQVLRAIRSAHVLGATHVVLHPPTARALRRLARRRFAKQVTEYRTVAADQVLICVENLPVCHSLGHIPWSPYALSSFHNLREFAVDNDVHIAFDAAHAATRTPNVLGAFGIVRDRVRVVHISDSDGRRQHLLPGHGRVALGNVIRRAALLEPRPLFTVEVDPHNLATDDGELLVKQLREAREFVEQAINSRE